jgi:hypothetical protein
LALNFRTYNYNLLKLYKPQRIQTYLILGLYFAVGVFLGFVIAKKPLPRLNSVTVDIVKENDKILIYLSRYSEGALRDKHNSGKLIFEYTKTNPTDKTAYRKFEDLWEEAKNFKTH